MDVDGPGLIADYSSAAERAGVSPVVVRYEYVTAPHAPPRLPAGYGAVYAFVLPARLHPAVPGAGRALKVGRVGPNSEPRFRYQHYRPRSARSTLAATLLGNPLLWPYLGIDEISEPVVGDWLRASCDRHHFFVAAADAAALPALETYVRGRLGPVFEGG